MTAEELSTRNKILLIAHKLFSEKGINGVSVREIAKAADVNVAAINYHFGNKDSLYVETISYSMSKMATEINNLYQDGINSIDLVSVIFDYFVENKEDFITGFKLFISDSSLTKMIDKDEMIGPPGGMALFKCLKAEFPKSSESDLIWVVRIIFTQMIHKAVLICNHCENVSAKFGMTENTMKDDILRLVKVLKKELT